MSWMFVILLFSLISMGSKKNNKKQLVSIVIPACNEEKTVASVVKVAKNISYVNEVIVVDDGSKDGTYEEAKLAGATVISHTTNQGKGSAIETGFKHSKGDIIAFIDADIHNLTPNKINNIIYPILNGKVGLTKTKFARESGRVTELTAKPLLKFFFPEITFEQPLSGQFAGKRSVLNKIKFEKDYGVDVGIVLDADAHGIQIEEVDIGEIKHNMSPLSDLNEMANEVFRTIVGRAIEYGRVTMMDSIGNYIRMGTLGLSLIILGLFTIFFVQGIHLGLGISISLIGIGITIYYIIKLIIKTKKMFRNIPRGNLLKSFVKMHFSIIISAFVLTLMISTFLSAASFVDGKISIEPTSRNLVIFPGSSEHPIYLRGPYSVDSALENEINIIRMPEDALKTLEISYGDELLINNQYYTINKTRTGEANVLRLPVNARTSLDVQTGDLISDGKFRGLFEGIRVKHKTKYNYTSINTTIDEYFIINSEPINETTINIYLDNKLVGSVSGAFKNNSWYDVYTDGFISKSIFIENTELNNRHFIDYGDHIIELKIINKNSTIKKFVSNKFGPFLQFDFN